MAGKGNNGNLIKLQFSIVKGVKKGAFIWVCPNVSDTLIPFAIENSLFVSITRDYFFFVSPAPPVVLEMDSLISVSDWMF